MTEDKCIRCGNKVPWVSFWGNFSLTIYKILVGVLGGSAALIADGLHSFTDVIGTSVILFTRRISGKPADLCHPYGHGKAEFLGSCFIYTVLIFISIAIFVGGLVIIIEADFSKPHFVTILGAGISVFYNVLMYMYGQCAGKKNNSPALLANSFENRADAVSSVACIAGISAAILIHPICDPIAAMVVGVVIFSNCVVQLKDAVSGLLDKSLPYETTVRIKRVAMAQEGVEGIDFVKTRQTGTQYWVDLGIQVSGDLDVTQSDEIATAVRAALMTSLGHLDSVEVFIAPKKKKSAKKSSTPKKRRRKTEPEPAR